MKLLLAVLTLFALSSQGVVAQDRAADRKRFLDAATPVSDDPRRVPVPPGPRGPEGAIVLRGGRIFDGTGAPAREGTLLIERNRIARVLPASSTEATTDPVARMEQPALSLLISDS